MRMLLITVLVGFVVGACNLVFEDETSSSQTVPDAPTTDDPQHDGGIGDPYDGGCNQVPDAGLYPDGGGWQPDAAWPPYDGGYVPDAAWPPPPDAATWPPADGGSGPTWPDAAP